MKPLKAEFQEAGDRKQEAVGGPCVRYRLLPSASCLPASAGLPRILHLITNFEVGGTERQAVELLKRLDPDRYDVRLAALRNQGPFYREIAGRFPDIPEFPLTSFYNANAVKQFLRLRALLARERVQILHAHDFYAGMIGAAAARSAGVKVIACQRHLRLSDRRVHEWGHRLIHRLAHRILVNSQAIRDHIVAAGSAPPEKVVVIENGLCAPDDDGTAPAVGAGRLSRHAEVCRELGLSQEAKLVGMVARLQPVKGHRFFLEAAAAVVRADSNVHFILVGGGPLREEIERQAAGLGIADRVHLLGERADVERLLRAFHLAALASLHEGLPNAVMEAMAAGVPVVATAVGGVAELIADGETGYLAPPGDARALAQRIMTALRDEESCAQIALRGQQRVMERFGMGRMVESVERLYDELLSAETRGARL